MNIRLILAAAAVVAFGVASATSVARPSASFSVHSTLDGRAVLPHHLRWLGQPSLPAAQIKEVDFLIDGKVLWVEHKPPYAYSGDDPGHVAYLVTSWLTPGMHRFAVRAVATDGRKATDTVRARVPKAPEPPAALAGTWERSIPDTSDAPAPGSPGNPTDSYTPPGTYRMVIDSRWIQHIQPGRFVQAISDHTGDGWYYESDYVASPTTFRVYGAVTRFQLNDTLADGGGWWCWQDGPAATYRWSVSGDILTLTPAGGFDPCGVRGYIWAGQWTRVH